MKVRWRQHENILAGIIAAILLTTWCWRIYTGEYNHRADPFVQHGQPFNFIRNVLMPDLVFGIANVLAYLYINYLIRKMRSTDKSGLYRLSLVLVILIIILGVVFEFSAYFRHQWQFALPGPRPRLGGGPIAALFTVDVYVLYAAMREAIIARIERSPRKDYFALVSNRLTGFLVIFLSIPFFAAAFRLVHEGSLIDIYFAFITPVYLMYMASTYWAFPLTEQYAPASSQVLWRLVLAALFCGIPFFLFPAHEGLGFGYLACTAILLFVVAPISWLLFQSQKDKIIQLARMEKALTKTSTDLQYLRSQINPHFLFNVLNTVYSSALQENAERTATAIQQLGDMMRFMLEENTRDFIPMKQEIEYLRNYISLAKMRTMSSPDIIVEAHIDDRHCNHVIAPMLFIPFVENAFKHGISLEAPSWVKLSLECTEKTIHFEVRNSTHPARAVDPDNTRTGIGNDNVIQRLNLVYPGRHQLNIVSQKGEYNVSLTINV